MVSKEQLDLVCQWFQSKKDLDKAKASEMELRKVVSTFFQIGETEEGSETIDLGEGYKVKKTQKLNYSCDPIERIEEACGLIDFCKYPQAAGIFKFKPELSITTYLGLPDEIKAIIDSVITVKSATPTIEIIVPKVKNGKV